MYTSIIGLFHKKSNRNILSNPLGLEVEFTNNAIKYSEADLQDEPGLSGKTTIADQIQGLLKRNPKGMVASEIAEQLDKNEGAIRKELNRKSKGKDIRFKNLSGKWVLATRHLASPEVNNKDLKYEENLPLKGGDVSSPEENVFNENEANEKLKEILGE